MAGVGSTFLAMASDRPWPKMWLGALSDPEESMSLSELLALIVPLVTVQLGLVVFALRDRVNPERRVKGGNKFV